MPTQFLYMGGLMAFLYGWPDGFFYMGGLIWLFIYDVLFGLNQKPMYYLYLAVYDSEPMHISDNLKRYHVCLSVHIGPLWS